MHDTLLYLIANPWIAAGLAILALLCVYNLLRRQVRAALAMWLVAVVVVFYIWVQIGALEDPVDDRPGADDIVAPPEVRP